MAVRRVHIPEVTLNKKELDVIRTAIRTGLGQWYNQNTEQEQVVIEQATESVLSLVLHTLTEIVKDQNAA